eukprot:766026-Hanusia_phi.AAC.5
MIAHSTPTHGEYSTVHCYHPAGPRDSEARPRLGTCRTPGRASESVCYMFVIKLEIRGRAGYYRGA